MGEVRHQSGHQAAIDGQDGAGDDAALVGGEVEHGFRHIHRLAEAEQMLVGQACMAGLPASRPRTRSVSVTVGAMALTRMRFGPNSTASERVSEATPPLAAV